MSNSGSWVAWAALLLTLANCNGGLNDQQRDEAADIASDAASDATSELESRVTALESRLGY